MTLLAWMQPRDPRAAGRTVLILCAVAAGVTVVFAPLQPDGPHPGSHGTAVTAGTVLVIVVLGLVSRSLGNHHVLGWAVFPLVAVAAIVVVDLVTGDSSVAAQIFFIFPTLYGASQLRPPGATVMTTASLLGEAVVVGVQLPLQEAVYNGAYVAAALITTAVLLNRGSERQARLVARLEELAALDPLTGMATRRAFADVAMSAIADAEARKGTSLVLLDIDHFKSINDRFGHPCGDDVLIRLASVLEHRTREGDLACRLGGDEIALLLSDCSLEVAERRAYEVLHDVRQHDFGEERGSALAVSVSIGVAHAPTHGTDLATLYAAADAALYLAKQSGRDRVVVAGDDVAEEQAFQPKAG